MADSAATVAIQDSSHRYTDCRNERFARISYAERAARGYVGVTNAARAA